MQLVNKHNQLDTHITFTYTLIRFKVSTCFRHYLPIFRRHYTNADLLTIVLGCRCGLVSGCGKTVREGRDADSHIRTLEGEESHGDHS
jgi:hypothetical protein